MYYTLENLVKILRDRLKDEEFDRDILVEFINATICDVLGDDRYNFLQKIDSVVADMSGEVNLPFDYQTTFYMYVNDKENGRSEISYIAPEDFFVSHSMNTYTSYGDKIFYNVEPGKTIEHFYLAKPCKLSKDSDKINFPSEFIEIIILGTMYRAEQYRDNFDFAQIFENKQDSLLTNFKLRYGPGQQSMKNTARLPYGGFHYGNN